MVTRNDIGLGVYPVRTAGERLGGIVIVYQVG